MKHFAAFPFYLLVVLAATEDSFNKLENPESRIINGYPAQRGQIPYIVLTLVNENPWCGGSIVSRKWIVSSAYCFNSLKLQDVNVSVAAGVVNRNQLQTPDTQIIPVTGVFVHPEYTEALLVNDIAMLKLAFNLKYTDTVQPIALPRGQQLTSPYATTSGWGIDAVGKPMGSSILKYFSAPLYPIEVCEMYLGGVIIYKESYLCTMISYQNGCHGDDGGPLEQNGYLIGIVSFGRGDCANTPTFYTKVSMYMDFIVYYLIQ